MQVNKNALRAIVAILGAIVVMASLAPLAVGKGISAEVHGGGGGAVWTAGRVDVYLFVRPDFKPYTDQAFADLKDAMPARGPRFILHYKGVANCDNVKPANYNRPVMTICSKSIPTYSGQTAAQQERHTIDRAGVRIELDTDELDWVYQIPDQPYYLDNFKNTIYHELMHGVVWINDCYGCRPDDSAVHGLLPYFGAYDIRWMQDKYRKFDTKERKRGEKKRDQRKHDRRPAHNGGGRGR